MDVPTNVKVLSLAEKTLKSHHLVAVGANEISKTPILVYHAAALSLLGKSPKLTCVLEHSAYPFAHEAGVYIPSTKSVLVTSNRITSPSGDQHIKIARLHKPADSASWTWTELRADDVPMPNGGVNHPSTGHVLLCAQGTKAQPSGLYLLDPSPADHPSSTPLLTHYHGRTFNSPNDVVVHPADRSIWFTDPIYGWEQGFRPRPQLPNQVYRFDPATGDVRVVADGFGRPNGICFAPGAETVYAFDVQYRHGAPFLANRRVFAMADTGIPDGIKCDAQGNVYSGCGDGLNVWNPAGTLLMKVLVDGGVSNFCFTEGGEVVLLNETRVWLLQLDSAVKGALLGL
ncbi:Six-bladed beta-propeller TolB-like protein [Macrophomina phaseolina MS6]|uniref:Six-bladed beta-propeller TolB-like protein n=1 Tax=Macrophomina phaseolina (strain MS6) TaxID=1126212 RepID=K2RKF6_MACPH|nr:Six-bladed beta-propeller TolB-like protein [Macrophomina phaseolina MS6]